MGNIKYIALPNPSINMGHIYQARELVDSSFAVGYFNHHLDEIDCAWVVLDDDKVVGWAAVMVEFDEHFNAKEGTLRCVVVDPNYRGRGIGKRLTEERLKYLGDCFLVWSYAWVRPDGRCMSCKNLENFGFVLQEELDDHYSDTRIKCKYCGKHCTCKARLYLKGKNG